ncbi:hypothetical protein BJV78DRAFT_226556 [Lactifluus subvellereus]|nr:hypothetical protein BJV78DRAFT_226556 [Lactifluus subvellereus]
MRCLLLTLTFALPLLGYYALPTLANTEIINFAAGKPVPVAPLAGNWTVLHPGANEVIVRDRAAAPLGIPHNPLCDADNNGDDMLSFFERRRKLCPHDLWLALDLDGEDAAWANYDWFTLRVSWPASHSAQVALSMHRAPSLAPSESASSQQTARLHIVHIRLAQEGVRVPTAVEKEVEEVVPLVVLLEPLVLGVLPVSVIPVGWTLLVVLGVVACCVLPSVWGVVEEVVRRARGELALEEVRKRK